MKFRRQFDSTPIEIKKVIRVGLTQPNMVEPLAKTLARIQTGNSFGVTRHNVEYDADVINNNDDEISSVNIDRSDPLTSIAEQTAMFYEIHKTFKHAFDEKKKKALEKIAIVEEKPLLETS